MLTLQITAQKAKDILWEESDEFEHIDDPIPGDEHRWYYVYTQILKEKSSGKLYSMDYYHDKGDNGDLDPFMDSDEVDLVEVEPYEVTVTKYRPVK